MIKKKQYLFLHPRIGNNVKKVTLHLIHRLEKTIIKKAKSAFYQY